MFVAPPAVVCSGRVGEFFKKNIQINAGEMNSGLLILRVASERRDAQNERDGAGLRSSIAAATPSQQRLHRSSVAEALQSTTYWHSTGRLRRVPAAPRGGTRRHLEGGRALRTASAPSQQHQLRRSSSSRRRADGSVPRP